MSKDVLISGVFLNHSFSEPYQFWIAPGISISSSQVLGLQQPPFFLGFLVGSEDMNSDLHACGVNALSTEPPPPHLSFLFDENIENHLL